MKVAVVILIVAFAGAFAQEATTAASGPPPFVCTSSNSFVCTFQELGHKIKYHATKLGGKLKDVGKSVLDAALSQGSQLLANAGQATLGTILEHLNKEGLVGKRAVLFDKFKEHIANGAAKLKEIKENLLAKFKGAVQKLAGQFGNMKVDADSHKSADDVVDKFDKDSKKGFFAMSKVIAEKMKAMWADAMAKLKEKYSKKVEARALADWWNNAKDKLSSLASTVKDSFKPHVDNLTKALSSLAEKAKQHGSNLVAGAKQSFDALKGKLATQLDVLKGHAATLGGHALNAVDALKQAVADFAKETLNNVKSN